MVVSVSMWASVTVAAFSPRFPAKDVQLVGIHNPRRDGPMDDPAVVVEGRVVQHKLADHVRLQGVDAHVQSVNMICGGVGVNAKDAVLRGPRRYLVRRVVGPWNNFSVFAGSGVYVLMVASRVVWVRVWGLGCGCFPETRACR